MSNTMYPLLLLLFLIVCVPLAQADEPKPKPITIATPKGWTELKLKDGDESLNVAARFEVGDKDNTVRSVVLRGSGSLKDNVNRWRGQLKLEPLDAEGVKKAVRPVKVGGSAGHRFDATGTDEPAQRIVAVAVERDEGTWFFRMSGPVDAVEKQLKAFDELLASARFAK